MDHRTPRTRTVASSRTTQSRQVHLAVPVAEMAKVADDLDLVCGDGVGGVFCRRDHAGLGPLDGGVGHQRRGV